MDGVEKRRVKYLKDLDFFCKVEKVWWKENIEIRDADNGEEMKNMDDDMKNKVFIDMYETCMSFKKDDFYKKLNEVRKKNWLKEINY